MSTTTPNFGWQVPTSTDLVKDGATAIETLGDAIDASLVDLKGGTTGQVLSKATNTDMDFVWTTISADITEVNAGVGISGGGTSGAVTITNSMATAIDAKGDLVAGTGADTFARLAVGANNTVLTADSTTATGLKWATPTSGGITLISSTALTGATITFSSIPQTYNALRVILAGVSTTVDGNSITLTYNSISANYHYAQFGRQGTTQISTGDSNTNNWRINVQGNQAAGTKAVAVIDFPNYTLSNSYVIANSLFAQRTSGNVDEVNWSVFCNLNNEAITSLSFTGSNFDSGTAYLYGIK